MFFFPKIKPKEHLLVKCMRLLVIVIIQTASFHALLHFLQSKFHRQLQAFHRLSLSFAVLYSLQVIYYKIYRGCIYCFFSASAEHKNDRIDEKLIVAAISFQLFLIPHHYRRRYTRLKGLLTLLFDSLSVIDMTKSLLKEKGAASLVFMLFFYSLSDPILSLICILRSTGTDSTIRGRRYLLLETIYIILFMLTNIGGLMILLFLGIGGKYSPPPLMTTAFIFKTMSASITTQFLSMALKRRYAAAISSFFKQLFVRTVMTEVDYYENSFIMN